MLAARAAAGGGAASGAPPLAQALGRQHAAKRDLEIAEVRAFAIAAVSCESEKPTGDRRARGQVGGSTRLTQADRGERVALVAGAADEAVAVKRWGPTSIT